MNGDKRTLLITAVLGLTLLLAGCTSAIGGDSDGSGDLPDDMTAEELQTKAVDASESVESATFTMQISATVDGDQTLEMDGDGAMDLNAEKMRLESEMDIQGQTIETVQYVIGDQMYINSDGIWQQQSAPDTWNNSQYGQQQDALESATEVEIVDQTTVNGHDVYEMDVDIDEETLVETVQQQGAQEGMEGLYEQMEISNTEMTQYVDTESYQIRQVEMEMDVSMMGQEMTMETTFSYEDINEPVDITLPEEAEDAPDAGADY